MKTKTHRPDSSNIATMKLSYCGKYVYVTFKKKSDKYITMYYKYTGVPIEDFYKVINAESVGSSFHKLIKTPGYVVQKVSRQRDPITGRFTKAI